MSERYEGDWVDEKYEGFGVKTWTRGSRYKGQFKMGLRHGCRVYKFYTGNVYAGEWLSRQSHGCGVHTCDDGSKYVGEYKWRIKHGRGYYHFSFYGWREENSGWLIQGSDEDGEDSSATPSASQDREVTGKAVVRPTGLIKVVSNPKKRKRDSGKTLSVMEKNFDAGGFIESQLLPDTDEFFRDADLSGQARWIYRSLLRAATIAKKVEPILENYHNMEVKLQDSQKDLTDSRSREESLKTKLSELEEKSKEYAEEANRLVEWDIALMKDLNTSRGEAAAAKKKVEELEGKLKLAESSTEAARKDMVALEKKNRKLAQGAREAVKLTEEGIKLQVAVLAPDLNLSQVGAFKTVENGKIVDILKS
ncbi:uncharacterized protein LOC107480059 [Arachis duranensis]|uniref:Uncharacterized protein LOC107480059 n=1 Tax=Arachis duranensis TaxID=130453 RepID=A0A6P4CRS2_ARADU|nr:uncharacterized protein LOC107480059 [Arachis duranensis]